MKQHANNEVAGGGDQHSLAGVNETGNYSRQSFRVVRLGTAKSADKSFGTKDNKLKE
jgi:hypothetical protein